MVLEVAILEIKKGRALAFEKSFDQAAKIISTQKGYLSHELKKCVEQEDKYILLVHWETLEDHETGFRQSEAYREWKQLLHHFYEPFPLVEHYQ